MKTRKPTEITPEVGDSTLKMLVIYRHLQRAVYLFDDIEEGLPLPDGVEEKRIYEQMEATRDMAGKYLLRLIGWADDRSILNQYNIVQHSGRVAEDHFSTL